MRKTFKPCGGRHVWVGPLPAGVTSTETVSVYLFRLAFNYFQTGRASALGYIVLFGVIVLTSLYLYAIQSRRSEVG